MPKSNNLPAGLAAASTHCVVCDLTPLALLSISGADAGTFLQGQLSNDVTALTERTWQYTSYNSPAGRMLANFPLWRSGDDPTGFRALLPGDIAPPVRERLARYVLRSKVTLVDESAASARFGIGGPTAAAAIAAVFGSVPEPRALVRSTATEILALSTTRFVVIAPKDTAAPLAASLQAHATPADDAVWRWLAIRAGVGIVTQATQDRFVPQMANLDALDGLSYQKGCYTGQEIVARTHYLGRLKERLFAYHAPASEALPEPGARVWSSAFGDQPCGTVVSAAPSPLGGFDLLAVLQIAAAASGDVRLQPIGGAALEPFSLPYAIPEPAEPRGRNTPGRP